MKKSVLLLAGAALLVGLTLLAYSPAFHGGFIFDDNVLLTENPLIKASHGLGRFWFGTEALDYWPVTSSVLWVEWRLWGMTAAGYHAVNVALHLFEALLLWALLRRLRLPGAFLGALLFTLHPVNAESVVWIAQLKNLLAMLFYLASIYWFAGADSPTRSAYWLSLGSFALAMLSKGSVVFLPLVLWGLVAWHRRPTRRDWGRLLPFFLVAGGLAAVEARFSTIEAFGSSPLEGFFQRLAGAGAAVWFYLGKAVFPVNLMFAYPRWDIHVGNPLWWTPLLAAAAATGVLVWLARRLPAGREAATRPMWRGLLFAWGYFCVALLPALGFAEVGFMKYTLVSDHYAHLATIGVTTLAAAVWAKAFQPDSPVRSAVLVFVAAAVVVIFGTLTWRQSRIYRDAQTLYEDTLARNPASWMAANNLGALWLGAGRLPEARARFEEALRLNPAYAEADNNLGLTLARMGRLPEALARYQEALRLRPGFAQAENNLGVALARGGRLSEAIGHFERALRIEPDYPEARLNLKHALELGGL